MEPATKHMLAGMTVHIGSANNHVTQFISPEWTLELFIHPIQRILVRGWDDDKGEYRTLVEYGVELIDNDGTVYARTVSMVYD